MSDETWDSGNVVVHPRRGIAVFRDGGGNVCIRQQTWDPNYSEDPVVEIPLEDAQRVIDALQHLVLNPGESTS